MTSLKRLSAIGAHLSGSIDSLKAASEDLRV